MNTIQIRVFYFLSIITIFSSCKSENFDASKLADKAITENGVHAVIEIPAGTNKKIEANKENGNFEIDRVIDFLPYPANYGYIHKTQMDASSGGDGDALDVIVISESLPTGTHIEVIPIAAILLKDNGEVDTKIVAVPVDEDLRIIEATDFSTFFMEYNPAFQIIEKWFLNYKGLGEMELINWSDEKKAMAEVLKWQVEEEAN